MPRSRRWRQSRRGTIRVACAQNGVENERAALRRFPNVHGMCLRMPGVHLEPGVVQVHQAGHNGICDVGSVPKGATDVDRAIAADLQAAHILSEACEDIMALKYAKLHLNVTNVLEAAIGASAPDSGSLQARASGGAGRIPAAGQRVCLGATRACRAGAPPPQSRACRMRATRRIRASRAATRAWKPTTSTVKSCSRAACSASRHPSTSSASPRHAAGRGARRAGQPHG